MDIQCRDMYLIAVACMFVVCFDHNLYNIITIFTQFVLDRRQDQKAKARCEWLPIEYQGAVQELYNGHSEEVDLKEAIKYGCLRTERWLVPDRMSHCRDMCIS